MIDRLSPNRTPGRARGIDRIVYHHTGGAFGPSLNWVLNPASQVSYHYMIDRHGQGFRTVPEGDTAWHAGTWDMNSRSIGVCGETGGWTAAAQNTFIWLTRDICNRRRLPLNRSTIIRHREVPGHPGTTCPGDLPIDSWVAIAAGGQWVPPGGDDMPDEATFKRWVREVLNEGTAQGLHNWPDTNREILDSVRGLYNWTPPVIRDILNEATGQNLQNWPDTVRETLQSVQGLWNAIPHWLGETERRLLNGMEDGNDG